MSSVRRPYGRLFQIRGPAAPKLLSPKLLCVRGTAHMLSEEDRRDRRLPSETRWISSARYVGIWPHNAWRSRQASWNSTLHSTHYILIQVLINHYWSTNVFCHNCTKYSNFQRSDWSPVHAGDYSRIVAVNGDCSWRTVRTGDYK